MRQSSRAVAAALTLGVLWTHAPARTAPAETLGTSRADDPVFTIAVVPDTQNYVDFTHQKVEGFPFDAREIFFEQMRWLAAHTESDGGDIAFVTAVGDIWQHASVGLDPGHARRGFREGPPTTPWLKRLAQRGDLNEKIRTVEVAAVRKGYDMLAGKVPFSAVPGNHDLDTYWQDAATGLDHMGGLDRFRSVFSERSPFFAGKPWYVASHDGGADSAQVFEAGGYRFLHIGLQWDPPDASLVWAQSVVTRFQGLPTIVSTHNYLNPAGDLAIQRDSGLVDPSDNNPQEVWDKLISENDQIFLVLCGHHAEVASRVTDNRFGHKVYQYLTDYQIRAQTMVDAGARQPDAPKISGEGVGDGWLRLFQFDMGRETPRLKVSAYSTHYKAFSADLPQYAAWYKLTDKEKSAYASSFKPPMALKGLFELNQSDESYLAAENFEIDLPDFRERFGPPRRGTKDEAAPAGAEWYRGNTHTHTLNSDGNVSPDAVVRWYREHGYQFVVITDHEFITDVAPLQAQFGAEGKFLVMKGQEITQAIRDPAHPDGERQAHVNAINADRVILPMRDDNGGGRFARTFPAPKDVPIARTFARNLAEVRAAGGVGQVNHPNFRWSLRLEDLVDVPDYTLYELWNGQPEVNNLGGTDEDGKSSPSTEALWDALLSRGKRIWAVASDDSHFFRHLEEANGAPPGQGWIVVRAERLTPESITAALVKGDFYASNGVTLDHYEVSGRELSIKIRRTTKLPSLTPDARFVTRFVGRGGQVLAEVPGLQPKYRIRGDEGYVRASVMDSNGRRAWTQPVFVD